MRIRGIALSLVLLTAGIATAVPASDTAPVAPFQADYEVLRNGKELGHATLTLRDLGGGTWEYSNRTKGTKGMASLLGLDVVEKSTFRWRDGQPEGQRYTYSQQASVKSRQRSTEFDWQAKQARSTDGKNEWTATLQPGAIDRNLATIALMAALKSDATDLRLRVVDKDQVADQRYSRGAQEHLLLPAGPIDALRIDRQREDSKRTTTTWFAPQRGWLPVQIEQVEKNGETVTLRLTAPR